MGWFGISNTVNRCNNACSMRADAQLVKTLQEKTKELSAALDAQLIHAGKLVYVANAAPPTQMLCSRHGDLSADEIVKRCTRALVLNDQQIHARGLFEQFARQMV